MSAAADVAAREIRSAPPLRLPPERAAGGRRRRAPRRWIRWAAPLTAAAAVTALALSLVLIRDIPNGGAVPANRATSTGSGGVPRYYVALKQFAGDMNSDSQRNDIVVGDSLTGKTLKTFEPPAKTVFESVTAAADDRTFVVFAVASSSGSFTGSAKDTTLTGRWYEVRLAPGTAHPARLSPVPIKPLAPPALFDQGPNVSVDAFIDSSGAALSGSGRELVVPESTRQGLAVKVFSVATGQLLHQWTTKSVTSRFIFSSVTWLEGDRELAIGGTTVSLKPTANSVFSNEISVYKWPVAELDNNDLLAKSTLVWNPRPVKGLVRFQYCFQQVAGGSVVISADGKTINCALGQAQSTDDILAFFTYPLTVSATVMTQGKVDYTMTLPQDKGLYIPEILWASPSGGTFIAAVIPYDGSAAAVANGPRFGVISHGKFTPLRFPPGFPPANQDLHPDQIAF
jgi:hypothetical protein